MVPPKVAIDSPAIEVMTDLRRIPAASIQSELTWAQANHAMILRGVRLLLVVAENGTVIGSVSAADLLGERPLQLATERQLNRDELTVRDLMVPADSADAIDLGDVLRSEVGHVVATLQRLGRQHLLVVDSDAAEGPMVRGIFSATQIARQLGVAVQTTEIARTFAQIETAMAG
ncbi:MAG: hypothetical protein IPJ21_01685 [Sterolibacteriaceae bacterium]|jgi:predicted transcriptional regulator|nr:hypothetical protein [Sterolibacteriaceae bacterium]MBK9086374.1 hypothetical protein [Sterolibacteriaceae bacterium]